jgi:phosphoribosylanthranilate isomerase
MPLRFWLETRNSKLETVFVTWIKICATTNLDDALASIDAGANALGFLLTTSPRQITLQSAAEIIAALPPSIEKVGVVVNKTPQRLAELATQIGLTSLQLHGDEPPDQLPDFRRALGLRKIIKTLQARELLAAPGMLDDYLRNSKAIDGILLDSGSPASRGGTGIPFDWNVALPIVAQIKEVLPVIIAGGLNPDNVSDAIRLFEPCGVDVVSGVERAPGKKDPAKLRAFIAAARTAASNTQFSHPSS